MKTSHTIAELQDDLSKVARLRSGGHPVRDRQRFPWIHRRELLRTHGKRWSSRTQTLSLPPIIYIWKKATLVRQSSIGLFRELMLSVSSTIIEDAQFWTTVAYLFLLWVPERHKEGS